MRAAGYKPKLWYGLRDLIYSFVCGFFMSLHKLIGTLPQRIHSCTVLQSVRNATLPCFFVVEAPLLLRGEHTDHLEPHFSFCVHVIWTMKRSNFILLSYNGKIER